MTFKWNLKACLQSRRRNEFSLRFRRNFMCYLYIVQMYEVAVPDQIHTSPVLECREPSKSSGVWKKIRIHLWATAPVRFYKFLPSSKWPSMLEVGGILCILQRSSVSLKRLSNYSIVMHIISILIQVPLTQLFSCCSLAITKKGAPGAKSCQTDQLVQLFSHLKPLFTFVNLHVCLTLYYIPKAYPSSFIC